MQSVIKIILYMDFRNGDPSEEKNSSVPEIGQSTNDGVCNLSLFLKMKYQSYVFMLSV